MYALTIQRSGRPAERVDVDRPVTAGGSRADEIHLPACPPAALRLVPAQAGVVVEAVACGVRVGDRPVPPGGRRLLRPGDRVELHAFVLALELPTAAESTRAAARALLRGAAHGEPPAAGPHLVVLSGATAGSRHALRADQTLGRGRAASIVLPDPHASRVHARIRLGPEGAWIEDLGSKNGVRVNGVRVEQRPCALRPGDELVIGETAVALEDVDVAAPDARPPPRGRGRRPAVPRHVLAAGLLALSATAFALGACWG